MLRQLPCNCIGLCLLCFFLLICTVLYYFIYLRELGCHHLVLSVITSQMGKQHFKGLEMIEENWDFNVESGIKWWLEVLLLATCWAVASFGCFWREFPSISRKILCQFVAEELANFELLGINYLSVWQNVTSWSLTGLFHALVYLEHWIRGSIEGRSLKTIQDWSGVVKDLTATSLFGTADLTCM